MVAAIKLELVAAFIGIRSSFDRASKKSALHMVSA
jgi:hypothetical protein